MYRPLAAHNTSGRNPLPPTSPTRSIAKPKKVSAACLACKQRKTKCSGRNPCDQCNARNSQCVYDLAADQRRKIANQRNIQELAQKGEDIERLCVLLGGILATIRGGNRETLDDLMQAIRTMSGLPELSVYIDGLMATWPDIYLEFQNIDFYLDDAPRRPSIENMENMDLLSSSTAARSVSEDMMNEEAADTTARRQHLQLKASGTKQSMTETPSSTAATNMNEHTYEPMLETRTDVPMGLDRKRSSGSTSDGGSARSNRTARPWELS